MVDYLLVHRIVGYSLVHQINGYLLVYLIHGYTLVIYEMEAEIQLLLKRYPDSSVSSLILVGWCEEGHPATKTLLRHSHG